MRKRDKCTPGIKEAPPLARMIKVNLNATHAFGCSYHRQLVGNVGAVEVFSFVPANGLEIRKRLES